MKFVAVVAGIIVFSYWAVGRAYDAQAHPTSTWIRVADCETGDGDGRYPYRADWDHNGRYDGGLQFAPSTWTAARRLARSRYRYAYQAPAREQMRVAERWLHVTSWRQWPACSRKLGLR